MQIVIAEHRERALAEFAHEAQHVERFRSAINQVAYKPQTVARTLESHADEQLPQLVIAPLDIANRIGRHTTLEARVETSILYRFRDVLGGDGGAGCKIRNGASDTPHAGVRARRGHGGGERMAQGAVAVPVGGPGTGVPHRATG